MKEIYVNLKRFDVPRHLGGICTVDNPREWIESIIEQSVEMGLGKLPNLIVTYLLPESLLIPAVEKLAEFPGEETKGIEIGSQGVFREDIKKGGNFGAFTTNLPAAAANNSGCSWSIIGHSEERADKLGLLAEFEPVIKEDFNVRVKAEETVDKIINQEVLCGLKAGLNILLCVGETAAERGEGNFKEQQPRVQQVLKRQLLTGLKGIKEKRKSQKIAIGYEPIWAIGPGKTPPGRDYIGFVSRFIKDTVKTELGFEPIVVYGGGLKEENASMISKIETIDGGLVALTRFSGEIGFYPAEFKKIIEKYLE